MKPTDAQISAEIAALTKMKPTVLETSGFGENHHDSIDAQIVVLDKRLSNDEIYSKYGDESSLEFAQNVLDESLNARNWMDGDDDEPPSTTWRELVR